MSGPSSRDDDRTGSDRLIFNAYESAAEHRERAELAPFVPDRVVSTSIAEAEYFASVIEYYSRLEPHLPQRPHYWEQVSLFPNPVGSDRNQVVDALMDYYNVDAESALDCLKWMEQDPNYPIEARDDEGIMHGLRSLQAWRSRTTRERQVYDDVLEGRTAVDRELPQYLPRKHTIRVHTVLDQAASKLGFGPEGDVPEEWEKEPI
ncbi:hypothetical protein [Halolamina salifodinae]|uniref:Uncharacterized protein n=1 Tax=Halolamina salifodinae TaxID=1202767 RepID=A0A8T4H0Y2_9EURY|nr:hypothetical protein [Halolamina salifodinae]MBP1987235.1 hypothetical protein [Halolamina salifodinae]